MTTAPAADQERLLDVQALDTRLAQLAHRRQSLPAQASLDAARAELADASREEVTARTEVRDLNREVAKAEGDVEQVRARADRDRARLDAGAGSPKDLQALTSELESLARRQAVLEETELEAMERLEDAERSHERVAGKASELSGTVAALEAEVASETGQIDAEAAQVEAAREEAARGLDAGLLALYERLRVQRGGLGAAALRGSRCEGCRLELNPTDLAAIRAMRPEDVARCEECGRILVRVPAGGGAAT